MTESSPKYTEVSQPLTKSTKAKVALDPQLKTQRIEALQKRNADLEAEIAATMATLNEVSKELKYPAKETVRAHIAHLHAYNEIRDIGQGLIGMVADGRDVRVAEVYEEFEVDARD